MENLLNDEKFEQIWIDDNVSHNIGSDRAVKKLSDSDYIDYHIWKDINWKIMYKKHLPDTLISRGVNPNLIFHGGCLRCISQIKHGIDRCTGCQYFKSDWNKKNLFIGGGQCATNDNEVI